MVRVSFNDQQYAAPMSSVSTNAVSFTAVGPTLVMSNAVYHVSEHSNELNVSVELIGEVNVLNVSVLVNVSFGGDSVLPGESVEEGIGPHLTNPRCTGARGGVTGTSRYQYGRSLGPPGSSGRGT